MRTKNLISLLLILAAGSASAAEMITDLAMPWVFTGYRSLSRKWLPDTTVQFTRTMWRDADRALREQERLALLELQRADSIQEAADSLETNPFAPIDWGAMIPTYEAPFDHEHPIGPETPGWLSDAIQQRAIADDFIYYQMVVEPRRIQFAEWKLPQRPKLAKDDNSFIGVMRRFNVQKVDVNEADITPTGPDKRINWLHTVNLGLQLSQAYISHNWYQGGNDYLAFFGNFLWDVQLNQVYHPKVMFQSTLNYKLAITSTSEDEYHKYSVSQELFQYNFKFGYKAAHKWYYSINGLFKTQFLHNYASNSMNRLAAFLSPGTLNFGVGMTYNYAKPNKKLTFSASLAPLSYNLKTCIDDLVDHGAIGMEPGQRIKNEYGSNGEVNFYWAFRDNISYKSRLFLFTDYSDFTADWENTLNFQFSKLFSTQLYFYFRYDTDTDSAIAPKWKKWMLKEILSVGLSYTFSTK